MTEEEKDLKHNVLECLYKLDTIVYALANGQYVSCNRKSRREAKQYYNELHIVIDKYKKADLTIRKDIESKQLWKISYYLVNKLLDCDTKYYTSCDSTIKELTEIEAIEWYNRYTPPCGLKKGNLLYKKEGEWVVYEITK